VGCLEQRAPCCVFFIDTLTPLTLSLLVVLSHALRCDQGSAERVTHQASSAVMWCGFDENLGNKARVVQGSLLLTAFARVCGKFCSETSHIAAAHGARTLIFKLTV
jgi:hypothetical protein